MRTITESLSSRKLVEPLQSSNGRIKFKVCTPHNLAIPPRSTYPRETHKYAQRGTYKDVHFNNVHRFKTTENMIYINGRVAK